jgi:hypothetical protein
MILSLLYPFQGTSILPFSFYRLQRLRSASAKSINHRLPLLLLLQTFTYKGLLIFHVWRCTAIASSSDLAIFGDCSIEIIYWLTSLIKLLDLLF